MQNWEASRSICESRRGSSTHLQGALQVLQFPLAALLCQLQLLLLGFNLPLLLLYFPFQVLHLQGEGPVSGPWHRMAARLLRPYLLVGKRLLAELLFQLLL